MLTRFPQCLVNKQRKIVMKIDIGEQNLMSDNLPYSISQEGKDILHSLQHIPYIYMYIIFLYDMYVCT